MPAVWLQQKVDWPGQGFLWAPLTPASADFVPGSAVRWKGSGPQLSPGLETGLQGAAEFALIGDTALGSLLLRPCGLWAVSLQLSLLGTQDASSVQSPACPLLSRGSGGPDTKSPSVNLTPPCIALCTQQGELEARTGPSGRAGVWRWAAARLLLQELVGPQRWARCSCSLHGADSYQLPCAKLHFGSGHHPAACRGRGGSQLQKGGGPQSSTAAGNVLKLCSFVCGKD